MTGIMQQANRISLRSILLAAVVLIAFVSGIKSSMVALSNTRETLYMSGEANGTEPAPPIISSKFAAGGRIYDDITRYPYEPALYGPLTYLIPGMLGRWFSWDGISIWVAGRAISFASGIAILLFSAIIWRTYGVRWWLIALGILTLVPLFRIWEVAFCFRPDMPAIALGLAGIAAAGSWNMRSSWLSLPLFLGAFCYKMPAALAAPAAAAVSLAGGRRYKDCLLFSASFVLLITGTIFLMNHITQGQFLQNTFSLGMNAPYSMTLTKNNLIRLAGVIPAAVLPGLFRMCQSWWKRSLEPLSVCALLSFVLGVLYSGRTGSDVNYFIESLIYLIILSIMTAEDAARQYFAGTGTAMQKCIAAALVAACLISVSPPPPRYLTGSLRSVEHAFARLKADLGTENIVTIIPELAVPGNLLYPYSDGFLISQLIKNGTMSGEALARHIRDAKYDYAILPLGNFQYQQVDYFPDAAIQGVLDNADSVTRWELRGIRLKRTYRLVKLTH